MLGTVHLTWRGGGGLWFKKKSVRKFDEKKTTYACKKIPLHREAKQDFDSEKKKP